MTEPATATTPTTAVARRVLMLAHTGREQAREVALSFVRELTDSGIVVRLLASEATDLGLDVTAYDPCVEIAATEEGSAADCELAVVIGGDGSILRAAEITRDTSTLVLGINLGHVGFLAEAEYDAAEATIAAIVAKRYTADERMTLDVRVFVEGDLVARTFALNEASVEKVARERMIEVVVEIDERPLSRWGCDGVVCATPTGSTAYNFSAGGPVVWPEVEALLMVPISAHALFARPMVVAPTSTLAIELIARTDGAGVLWCDGRRTVDLPPGARIEVRRGEQPVRLARLHDSPFTDRLVAKFGLSIEGWRGSAERRQVGHDHA
ncbi:MAG: NAD kinase [Nocardioides sp.]|nr:NAD kinase [Nocardioides sp.]